MNEKKTNRTRVVTFRLTTDEYEKIEAKFKTTTCRKLSDYMRYILLDKKLTVFTRNKSMDDFMAELILLRNELNAIGNNYNQVVKKLHLLQTIPEFKVWFLVNESAKESLVKKVDEIKLRINQIFRQMVARIKKTHSLSNAVNYNEKKVQQHKAEYINAVNYAKDPEQLNFYQKLHRLEHLAALNERVQANGIHISLNFDAADKLDKEKLNQIGVSYMQQIGFGKQPYLVYQHFDSGHQHIHIVSTNITADGSRIEMNNIGRNESEQARKQIEIEFKLVQAESKKQQQTQELKAVSAQRITYGKSETKRAITNVLDVVLPQYKYASLAELNVVLKLYNVMADRGPEASKMYEGKGLVYRVLDEKGNKIGTPIKASAFYNKPTLPFLEQKFKENEVQKLPHKRVLKTKIDWALLRAGMNLKSFSNELQKQGIHVALRQNAQGLIYGVTYVDHVNKTVFNGSDIGKEYSAKALLEKLNVMEQKPAVKQVQKTGLSFSKSEEEGLAGEIKTTVENSNVIVELLQPEKQDNYLPHQFKKKKRKQSQKLH